MTDEDRYGRKLGKKFEAIRGRLCSSQEQDDAPDAVAAYMLRQFLLEMPQFKDRIADAVRAIEMGSSLFDDVDALNRIKRTTNGSPAEDHFIQSMREVVEERKDAREILRRLAARGIDSYGHILKNQTGYADDVACQQAFAKHAIEIERCFINRIFAKAGFAPSMVAAIRPKESTRSLLDLQIVGDKK
ncbi:MAG TPA: hypothetical protein VKT72_18215 [Candidatus Baltobacteraceae bacterium]|nr:hypothetical protein [Candidatus Baltobacteraceae bacterium]